MALIDRHLVRNFAFPSAALPAARAATLSEAIESPTGAPTLPPALTHILEALAKRGLVGTVERTAPRAILRLQGRLEQSSVPLLKDGIRELLLGGPTGIDVHMGGIKRVDGVGLAALVWAWGSAKERGCELRLTHMPPDVLALVERLNLHQLLCVVDRRSDDA